MSRAEAEAAECEYSPYFCKERLLVFRQRLRKLIAMSPMQTELAAHLTKLPLTPRLIDVLALLLQGKSNKLIARELSLSPETVKEYVAIVLRRLGVSSRAQVPMVVHPYFESLLDWDSARRRHTLPRPSPVPSSYHYARP